MRSLSRFAWSSSSSTSNSPRSIGTGSVPGVGVAAGVSESGVGVDAVAIAKTARTCIVALSRACVTVLSGGGCAQCGDESRLGPIAARSP